MTTLPGAFAQAGAQVARSLMTDACTISAPSTRGALDPATLTYASTPGAVLYSGPCRVRPSAGLTDEVVAAGGQPVSLWRFVVSIPLGDEPIDVDQTVVITASSDATLVGRRLRVRQAVRGSQITARRLHCEEQET